jgi:hypothetical protein
VQTEVNRIFTTSEGCSVFNLESNLGAEVVPQVLSYSGELMNHGYPKLLKLVPGPDSRQHEQVGRFDGAGAQHNPVCLHAENLTAAFGFHANYL